MVTNAALAAAPQVVVVQSKARPASARGRQGQPGRGTGSQTASAAGAGGLAAPTAPPMAEHRDAGKLHHEFGCVWRLFSQEHVVMDRARWSSRKIGTLRKDLVLIAHNIRQAQANGDVPKYNAYYESMATAAMAQAFRLFTKLRIVDTTVASGYTRVIDDRAFAPLMRMLVHNAMAHDLDAVGDVCVAVAAADGQAMRDSTMRLTNMACIRFTSECSQTGRGTREPVDFVSTRITSHLRTSCHRGVWSYGTRQRHHPQIPLPACLPTDRCAREWIKEARARSARSVVDRPEQARAQRARSVVCRPVPPREERVAMTGLAKARATARAKAPSRVPTHTRRHHGRHEAGGEPAASMWCAATQNAVRLFGDQVIGDAGLAVGCGHSFHAQSAAHRGVTEEF